MPEPEVRTEYMVEALIVAREEAESDATGTKDAAQVLQARVHTYRQTAERAQRDRDFYKTALAAVSPEGLPCVTCGKGLRPKSYRFGEWKHRRKADEEPCRLLRVERARVAARVQWDAWTPEQQQSRLGRWSGETPEEWIDRQARYVGPPQPLDLDRLDDDQEGAA